MNVQRDFAAKRRQLAECRHRDDHVVTDTHCLDDRLIRVTGYQFSAQVSNHQDEFY
jgi:hypothetical protein